MDKETGRKLPVLKIGNVEIEKTAALAPMASVAIVPIG